MKGHGNHRGLFVFGFERTWPDDWQDDWPDNLG